MFRLGTHLSSVSMPRVFVLVTSALSDGSSGLVTSERVCSYPAVVHCSLLLKKLALRPTSFSVASPMWPTGMMFGAMMLFAPSSMRLVSAYVAYGRKPKGSCCERLTLQDLPESVPRISAPGAMNRPGQPCTGVVHPFVSGDCPV